MRCGVRQLRAAPAWRNRVFRRSGCRRLCKASATPSHSERVHVTDPPVIVKTKTLIAGAEGVLSLAQGVVHWQPPPEALAAARELAADASVNSYGPADGMPALVAALKRKVAAENGLLGHEVMVTAGANQAFVNVLLTLVDADDGVVLFAPYYFNHLMAVQMTGGAGAVVLGPCCPDTWHPDLDWLETSLAGPRPPRMVVIINPCNPTGALLEEGELERAAELTRKAGAWLVVDNTYEHFVYDGRRHACPVAPHVLHIFSFSKAFGMMGWRIGYIAYLDTHGIGAQLLKGNREALMDALAVLGAPGVGLAPGEGAIYLWARLPKDCDDEATVAWLVRRHKVCLIPGSACGAPGYVRAAFANLQPGDCAEAAARLKCGLQELVTHGPAVLEAGEKVLARPDIEGRGLGTEGEALIPS